MESNKDILFNRIEASLRYGVVPKPKKTDIILERVIAVICGIGAIVCLICTIIFKEPLVIIGIVIFFIISLLIIIGNARPNKIKLWLEDAVEIKASCLPLGKVGKEHSEAELIAMGVLSVVTGTLFDATSNYASPRIILTFKHNGKLIKRMSGEQGYSDQAAKTGRDPVFKKYIGREIDILYSPKYDQVLLLKIPE